MYIKKKDLVSLIGFIEDAKKYATCETARFSHDKDKNAMIKDTIELHHDTWIIHPLNEALRILGTGAYMDE